MRMATNHVSVPTSIETCGFRVDDPYGLPDSSTSPADKFNKQNFTKPLQNSDFGHISALGLDRDLGFSVDDPHDLPDSSILSADKFTKPNFMKNHETSPN